ncbi:MAG TPA: GNAT family N-acetyltransferase [Planctomycetota bacterium]|nr:GNAT family N-acetyltransferase [Planctomycetota bacterium]
MSRPATTTDQAATVNDLPANAAGAPSVRVCQFIDEEPDALLELYRHLHLTDPTPVTGERLREVWRQIRADPNLLYVLAEVNGLPAATCTLTIVPNLTHGARPYGVIENVVTHPDLRRQGLGTAVLKAACEQAWNRSCYKVTLTTGRTDPGVHAFYAAAGFVTGVKTAYVAKP